MSLWYYSDYWFVNTEEQGFPPDWADQKAKELVADEPGCRKIVKSCGWAVLVEESFKNRPPRLPKVEGCLVAHKGCDSMSAMSLHLGITAYGEFVEKEFDEPVPDDPIPDTPHCAIYDNPVDLRAGE